MASCSRCHKQCNRLKIVRVGGHNWRDVARTEFVCRECTYEGEEGEFHGCYN